MRIRVEEKGGRRAWPEGAKGGKGGGARPAAHSGTRTAARQPQRARSRQELQDVDTEQGLSWGFNNPTYSQDISTADSSTTRSEMGDHTNFLASCEEPLQALIVNLKHRVKPT